MNMQKNVHIISKKKNMYQNKRMKRKVLKRKIKKSKVKNKNNTTTTISQNQLILKRYLPAIMFGYTMSALFGSPNAISNKKMEPSAYEELKILI